MCTGTVSLVSLKEGTVGISVIGNAGEELLSFNDLNRASKLSFEDRLKWFRSTCKRLMVEWNEGHMRMNVRRDYLLSDSMAAVMSLSAKDLRKVWRFEFIGEPGIDTGNLAAEWYELVTKEIFDPMMGLWQPSSTDQMRLQINSASEICCPEDHLYYFRFIGRVLGKALFDGHNVKGHLAKYMYKYMLGWPIMFSDLKDLDEDYHNFLRGLNNDMGADIECIGLNFSVSEDILGENITVELIPGGSNIDVTEDNLPEYLEACLKYRLLNQCEYQTNELLLGFFDVIPQSLLSVFDYEELELLLCEKPPYNAAHECRKYG
jgi:hypothetical protein